MHKNLKPKRHIDRMSSNVAPMNLYRKIRIILCASRNYNAFNFLRIGTNKRILCTLVLTNNFQEFYLTIQ